MLRTIASAVFLSLLLMTSCNDEDVPAIENDEEIITDIRLIFSPREGGSPLVFRANDPDGEGVAPLAVLDEINLAPNVTYDLFIEMENGISGIDIGEEVEEEADEHQLFFAFTENIFENPSGAGNIAPNNGSIEYEDNDVNGLALGLKTAWRTGAEASGTFRVVLKHQPDIKSATSTSNDGSSDLDVTWDISIK